MTVPPDILAATLASTLKLEQSINARLTRELAEARDLLRRLVNAATSEGLTSGNDREAAQADAALVSAIAEAQAHLNPHAPATTQGGEGA
jgi:hypothetical protein